MSATRPRPPRALARPGPRRPVAARLRGGPPWPTAGVRRTGPAVPRRPCPRPHGNRRRLRPRTPRRAAPSSSASRSTRKLARSNSGSPHAKRSKSTSPSRPVSSTSHCPGCAAPWTGTRGRGPRRSWRRVSTANPRCSPLRQGRGRRGSPGQGPLGPPQLVCRVIGVGGGERGHGELAERDPDLSSEPEALGAEQAWLQRVARHDAVPARTRPLVPTLRFGHGEREGSGGREPSNGHVPPAGRRSPWRTPSRTGPRARVRRARCSGCRGGSARPSDPPVPRAPSAVPAARDPARRA